MKTTAYAALICSAALLAGCISVPEPTVLHMSELRNKDFGRYPDNYQAIIKRRLAETLIDPDSAKIAGFTPPRKYLRVYQDFKTQRLTYYPSYAVCVRINSKNSYGGYTGWQTKMFRFKNNTIEGNPTGAYAACTSKDEIYIDTTLIFGGDQVNIVP